MKHKEEILQKLRDIIATFKSPRAREDLRAALKRKDVGLCTDTPTRWNSTYHMCKSALKMREELDEYLVSTEALRDLFLDDDDWTSIKDLCEFLKPFSDATDELSASDSPTIHLAVPYVNFLLSKLDEACSAQSVSSRCLIPSTRFLKFSIVPIVF